MASRLALAALVIGLSTVAASAQSWTVTGSNGATAEGSRDSTTADGTRTCTSNRLTTGPNGKTREVSRDRTATRGEVTTTRDVRRANGSTGNWTRVRTR